MPKIDPEKHPFLEELWKRPGKSGHQKFNPTVYEKGKKRSTTIQLSPLKKALPRGTLHKSPKKPRTDPSTQNHIHHRTMNEHGRTTETGGRGAEEPGRDAHPCRSELHRRGLLGIDVDVCFDCIEGGGSAFMSMSVLIASKGAVLHSCPCRS